MSNRKKLTPRNDEALPFLTIVQANRVRALMRGSLAERGLETTIFDDHLLGADGRAFGVWNVASRCHRSGRSEVIWRRIIDEHVTRLLAGVAGGDPFEGLTDTDLEARTFTRLWAVDALPGGVEGYPHVEFVPGVAEAISLRIPDGVAVFNRDRVEQYGGWERLHAFGRANLAAQEPEGVEFVTTKEGAIISIARGDSTFTASHALLMPGFGEPVEKILRQVHGAVPAEGLGWLLSIPNRHEVVWHVIRDASAMQALAAMADYTPSAHADSPGPLSPHVFWWSGDGYRQVTTYGPGGRIGLVRDEDLLRTLARVM